MLHAIVAHSSSDDSAVRFVANVVLTVLAVDMVHVSYELYASASD